MKEGVKMVNEVWVGRV